jgi:SAM-dependent methyltransferase
MKADKGISYSLFQLFCLSKYLSIFLSEAACMLNIQIAEHCAESNHIKTLPLRFGQMREDAQIEAKILSERQGRQTVLTTASAGCTAAYVSTVVPLSKLTVVDQNLSNLALTKIKLYLLQDAFPSKRLKLLGHLPMDAKMRKRSLQCLFDELELPEEILGPLDYVALNGPDLCGRFEALLPTLREHFKIHKKSWQNLLNLDVPAWQARLLGPNSPLKHNLDDALDTVFNQDACFLLFGDTPLARYFAKEKALSTYLSERLYWAFKNFAATSNPYLQQMLAGRYRSLGSEIDCAPWLTVPVRPQDFDLNFIHIQNGLAKTLASQEEASYDLITLSNELDHLEKADQIKTLAAAAKLLKPGGVLLLRSMLDTAGSLNVENMPTMPSSEPATSPNPLAWQKLEKSDWEDRGFLNSQIYLGVKKV